MNTVYLCCLHWKKIATWKENQLVNLLGLGISLLMLFIWFGMRQHFTVFENWFLHDPAEQLRFLPRHQLKHHRINLLLLYLHLFDLNLDATTKWKKESICLFSFELASFRSKQMYKFHTFIDVMFSGRLLDGYRWVFL